ncbi:MAG: PAS domain S-box protein [Thermoanaerobaculia bacterium]
MTRPLRVLHLEDNPRDAALIRDRLDADGLSCEILLANGRTGFEAALAREPFDLIIFDYHLPGYDGASALRQAQATQPDVPVILVSGTVSEETAVQCLKQGATDYLIKSRLDRLVPAVRRAIEESGARLTRKRAEAALAQSEKRKAAILDSVLDCIVTMDASGAVIEFNAAAERTFGYTKAEAIGRPLAELIIPPAYRAAHAAGLARYLSTLQGKLLGKVIEIIAVRSDGSELPVELVITAIHSEATPIFTGVLRDISARKLADETRARLAAIVDCSEDAIFSMSLDGTILTWNSGAERLYGYSASEAIGQNRTFLAPAEASVEIAEAVAKAVRGEPGEALETRRIRKDGTVFEVSLTASPMTDSSGQVTGISAIARNITTRKKAEAALRAAEERTQFILQNASVGVWDMDYASGVLKWSGTMEAQYGLSPGTFGGTFKAFVEGIHPEDRTSVLQSVREAMASGSDFAFLHRTLRPDGTIRWLNAVGRTILDAEGDPLRAVGISLDVTERREMEQQFHQAQKMEAIGQLAGGVAHDFNNLLTIILGNCELMLDERDPADPLHADLAEIQKAGQSAASLTRQLLAFSRQEIIEPTLLDLNEVLAGMRAMLRRLIREDVTIELRLRPAPASIKADRSQIEQLILNLAVNARDAMPKGGTLTIEIGSAELNSECPISHGSVNPGPFVSLSVIDTGEGMTAEVQSRLFEPFFTTKEVGKGTGLGLAMVHGIVRQNGGCIDVISGLGTGTTLRTYFPQVDSAEMAAFASPPVPRARAGGETVLVVEDQEGLRLLTRKLLQRLGYTVLVAQSAGEALRLFEENPAVDVVLTDVVMPGGSGPDLTCRLLELWPDLKVIYMSGYTDDTIVRHGVLEPGVAFLQKPFSSDALGRKIREILDR